MTLLKVGCCLSALFLFFAGLTIAAKAELIECPIIADTLFSGHFNEHDMNNGALQALVGKAILGIPVFRFDMSKLKHHKIEGGTFSVYPIRISAKHVEQQDLATSRKISTIAHDWIEGKGINAFPPESREWATFDWPGRAIAETWGIQTTMVKREMVLQSMFLMSSMEMAVRLKTRMDVGNSSQKHGPI